MRIFSEGDFLPRYLDAEEKMDPRLVIRELFELEPLPYLREALWEFFKTMVTGDYSHRLDRHERRRLLLCYEHLQKLIEAVHLLYQSDTNEERKFDPGEIFGQVFGSENFEAEKPDKNSGECPELST